MTVCDDDAAVTEVDAPAGDIGAYYAEIVRYPLLTAQEEIELARQIADGKQAARHLAMTVTPAERLTLEQQVEAGDLARRRMIESNLRLVVSVARRYASRGLSVQDLIQEGNIGLQAGIDKYDWRKGYRLSTYVYWWIRQAITRALANDSRIIRLPVHAGELLRLASAAEEQLQAELGERPTVGQVAARIGVAAERLSAIRRVASSPGSLDAPLKSDSALTQGDTLIDEAASAAFRKVGSADDLEQAIGEVLEDLPERERAVVKLHFGLGDTRALTLAEIGEHLGVTRERARQIEGRALRRLRGDTRMRRAFVELAAG